MNTFGFCLFLIFFTNQAFSKENIYYSEFINEMKATTPILNGSKALTIFQTTKACEHVSLTSKNSPIDLISKQQDDMKKISQIITQDKDKITLKQPARNQVIEWSKDRICHELLIYQEKNKLNLITDNQEKDPCIGAKFPPMRMELVKSSDLSSYPETVNDSIDYEIKRNDQTLKKLQINLTYLPNDSELRTETIERIKNTLLVNSNLKLCKDQVKQSSSKLDSICKDVALDEDHDYKLINKSISQLESEWIERSPSVLKMYIEYQGKLLPFKTFKAPFLIRNAFGPKLAQGDYDAHEKDHKTPEGSFNLNNVNHSSSEFFVATNIDFEGWMKDNRKLLIEKGLPPAANAGGAIKIHGAGGSDGCLSLSNKDSAFVAAFVENLNQNNQPAKIDIYPFPMTSENLKRVEEMPAYKKYIPFWKTLAQKAEQTKSLKIDSLNGVQITEIDDILQAQAQTH